MFESKYYNARTDRCNLMCYIDEYKKQYPSYVDYGISGGGNA